MMTYDYTGNMIQHNSYGTTSIFSYDADNQWVRRRLGSSSLYYFMAGGDIYAEYDGSDVLQAEYVYGLDGMVAKIDARGDIFGFSRIRWAARGSCTGRTAVWI